MHLKYHAGILFLLLTLSYAACTKHADGITGPQGAAGPAGPNGANGDSVSASPITGYIDLYTEYGYPDSSNAGVTLTTMKGDSIETATTDATGKFSLPPLPPGNYDIHITRTGFDSLKTYVQHAGGNEAKFIGDIHMYGQQSTKITNITLSISQDVFNNNILIENVTFDGPPSTGKQVRAFDFFFSRSSAVSSVNYDAVAGSENASTASNQYQLQYELGNLTENGIVHNPGDTIYVKTIVAPNPNSVTTWFDYATYKTIIYPYFGDSTTNYFLWP